MAAKVITGVAFEGKALVLLARIVGEGGEAVGPADIASIAYDVWKIPVPIDWRFGAGVPWQTKFIDTTLPVNFAPSDDLDPEDVIEEELVVDDRWTVDSEGYNFAAPIPAAKIPTIPLAEYPKSQCVAFNVVFTPVVGDPIPATFVVEVKQFLFGKA